MATQLTSVELAILDRGMQALVDEVKALRDREHHGAIRLTVNIDPLVRGYLVKVRTHVRTNPVDTDAVKGAGSRK